MYIKNSISTDYLHAFPQNTDSFVPKVKTSTGKAAVVWRRKTLCLHHPHEYLHRETAVNLSKEKNDLCSLCSIRSVLLLLLLLLFFTAGGGIKRLYLQPGHPEYLLNKLPEEIFVYIRVCDPLTAPSHHVLAEWTGHAPHQTIQMKIKALIVFKPISGGLVTSLNDSWKHLSLAVQTGY